MDVSALLAARARIDVGEGLKEILALANDSELISFAGGFPDPATFPGLVLVELLESLVQSGDASALQYGPTSGLPSVRDYLSTRLQALEGRRPAAGEIMVTSGAIEALDLVCKRFLDPGDAVVVEGPTYLGAIMAFRGHGADVVAVAMDDDGLDVEGLERRLRDGLRPKLLYTIPDHQNPSGATLSEDRRGALVELAGHYGFLIVEDVAYRELYFDAPPLQSLWARAPDRVVQAGTFSKTFFPGVRLGWAAGPADIVDQMVVAKQNTDQCAGALGQRLLEEYGRAGHLEGAVAASRDFYRRRRDRLVAALARDLPEHVHWSTPRGGFFVWLEYDADLDSVQLARRGRDHGVAFVPGVPFFPDGRGGNNVRLAFSRVEDDAIEEGCRRLGKLFAESA